MARFSAYTGPDAGTPANQQIRAIAELDRVYSALRRFKVLFCLVLAPMVAPSQTKPSFEVASIRPTALDMAKLAAQARSGEMPRIGVRVDGARAEFIFLTLKDLIAQAYKVKPYQITGPDWIGGQRFDILAKLPEGASKDEVPMMLQALLEDRFKLSVHRESKEHAVLALVVGKGGPKMKESAAAPKPIDADTPLAPGERQMDGPDGPIRTTVDTRNGSITMNMGAKGSVRYSLDPATRSVKIEASHVTMSGFADMLTALSQYSGGQQVKDMTGLAGNYEVAISFSLEDLMSIARAQGMALPNLPAQAPAAASPADAASVPGGTSTVLQAVQSMGLKLESRKAQVEQLVIDHVEKEPTAN
ncbi:MAG TPA: TIGR03435 family protein [Bryobacteraceae bacterium]|nr:TIGR03435 family protein [Bryobacteraceae bacterium]